MECSNARFDVGYFWDMRVSEPTGHTLTQAFNSIVLKRLMVFPPISSRHVCQDL